MLSIAPLYSQLRHQKATASMKTIQPARARASSPRPARGVPSTLVCRMASAKVGEGQRHHQGAHKPRLLSKGKKMSAMIIKGT